MLKQGGEIFIDFDLDFLKDTLAVVDAYLARLEYESSQCDDPDGFGVFDRIEHMAGMGFAACQRYLTAVCGACSVAKSVAFDRGPQHRSGIPIAAIANAAANYWKHSSEWTEPPTARARETQRLLEAMGVDMTKGYVVANLFHRLMSPLPKRFEAVVPFLEQWRNEVCELQQ